MSDFWRCSGSSNDSVFWVSIYGRDRKLWHDFTIMPLYRIGRKYNSIKWWLRHRFHPKYRFFMVNTGLKPGYYDEDERMLHACFALLCEYIKSNGGDAELQKWSEELLEEPDKNAPPGWQSSQGKRQIESVVLYRGGTVERPADQRREDELVHRIYSRKRMIVLPEDDRGLTPVRFEPLNDKEVAMEKELRVLQDKIRTDTQSMLHRLIDIRESLWT